MLYTKTTLLDGKETSLKIKEELAEEVISLTSEGHRPPHLLVILVGENPASKAYVGGKVKACEKIGYKSSLLHYEPSITEEELVTKLLELNQDDSVDGILVQLPLPDHISENKIIETIAPEKDVDGFHPVNIGRMAKNLPAILPATPAGILELLKRYEIDTKGKECVVVGRSNIVGSPISILMARNSTPGNATVTLTHRHTQNLEQITRSADILIVAVGIPGFIREDMIKPGATVIDVGINRVEDETRKRGYRLVGDVDPLGANEKAAYYTPVPGGVGPMTIALLLKNTMQAYRNRNSI